MAELHETILGRKVLEHDIPEIGKQLKRIADALENKNPSQKHVDFLQKFIDFLEYEEGFTKDNQTSLRIRKLLQENKIWP